MRLLKEYQDFIHWRDWTVESPAPGVSNLLGWAIVCFHIPGEHKSVRGYYWQVRLPIEADKPFKEAGRQYARRMLIKNFDLPLKPEHVVMRHVDGTKPYDPFLQRLLQNFT